VGSEVASVGLVAVCVATGVDVSGEVVVAPALPELPPPQAVRERVAATPSATRLRLRRVERGGVFMVRFHLP
jgi:hypothetical protein